MNIALVNKPMLKKLVICGLLLVSTARADMPASVFWYQEKESGTPPSTMRYLVVEKFMRIDEGEQDDNYILFDAAADTIYSINHADRSVLVIGPQDWEMPDFAFDHQVTDAALQGAPQIDGKSVRHYLVTGDDKVCTDVQYVPGMYPEQMAMMQHYQQVLAGQQVRSLAATPEELRTPCFLADQVYNDGAYYARGLPVQIWHSRGYGRILTDFKNQQVADELFTLPEEYRHFNPFVPQGDAAGQE